MSCSDSPPLASLSSVITFKFRDFFIARCGCRAHNSTMVSLLRRGVNSWRMIVTVSEYDEIVKRCRILIETFELPSTALCEAFHLDYDALLCICNQLYIRQTKKFLPSIEQDLQRIAQVDNIDGTVILFLSDSLHRGSRMVNF
jgi:hypothetical protein